MVHPGELWNGAQRWEESSYSKSCVYGRRFVKCGLNRDKPEDFSASHPDCMHNPASQAGQVLFFPTFSFKPQASSRADTHVALLSSSWSGTFLKIHKSGQKLTLEWVVYGFMWWKVQFVPLPHYSQITLQPIQTENKLPGFASFWDTGVDLVSEPLVH